MEDSAHQNQGRGPTFSPGTFARNPNRAAGAALDGTASGCLCLECSASELVLLPTPTYKKKKILLPSPTASYTTMIVCPFNRVRKKQEPSLRNPRG